MTSAQCVKSYCIIFVVSVVFECCFVLPLLPTYVSLFVSSRWDLSIENQLKFVLITVQTNNYALTMQSILKYIFSGLNMT